MSYSSCELAVLTLVRSLSAGTVFTTTNSMRGDWQVLDAPGVRVACVVAQREASTFADRIDGRGSHGQRMRQHRIVATVFTKKQQGTGGDGAIYTTHLTTVDSLAAHLEQYPKLNGAAGVLRGMISSIGAISETPSASHYYSEIQMDVLEQVNAQQQETPS
jgi:hypothetical protein